MWGCCIKEIPKWLKNIERKRWTLKVGKRAEGNSQNPWRTGEIKKVEKYQFSTDLARDPGKITKRILKTREYENDKSGGRKVIKQEMEEYRILKGRGKLRRRFLVRIL